MKLLLYCTKGKKQLVKWEKYMYGENGKNDKFNSLNGKIVAECDFEVEERLNFGIARRSELMLEGTCLTIQELDKYLGEHEEYNEKDIYYAIHIKNLHIFNEPRELRFYYQKYKNDKHLYNVEKAPQNMMKVIGKQGDEYVLISIHPEWLCKILNGEKTIEIRKKVLKGMMSDKYFKKENKNECNS